MSTIYSYQIGDRTHTVHLDIIVRQLRDRIAQGKLLVARDIHSKLRQLPSSIATHPLVLAEGAEIEAAEAMDRHLFESMEYQKRPDEADEAVA